MTRKLFPGGNNCDSDSDGSQGSAGLLRRDPSSGTYPTVQSPGDDAEIAVQMAAGKKKDPRQRTVRRRGRRQIGQYGMR